MKKLTSILFLLGAVLIISSCATTTHPNQNKLVGLWAAQKVSPADPNIKIDPNAKPEFKKPAATDTTAKVGKKGGRGGTERTPEEIEYHRQQQFIQYLRTIERTKLKINADRTAQMSYPGKTVDVKWKMKKDGKQLIVKTKEHGKIRGDIQMLSDSTMIVLQHFEVGDIIVKYVRK